MEKEEISYDRIKEVEKLFPVASWEHPGYFYIAYNMWVVFTVAIPDSSLKELSVSCMTSDLSTELATWTIPYEGKLTADIIISAINFGVDKYEQFLKEK
jgi:hypothetical protein